MIAVKEASGVDSSAKSLGSNVQTKESRVLHSLHSFAITVHGDITTSFMGFHSAHSLIPRF